MSQLARELLGLWFEDCDSGVVGDKASRRWFTRDDAFDDELRKRFGPALDQAARGQLGSWCITPHGSLALVVLCDQVSRNIHRGTARAYATDPLALHESLAMLARGQDRDLTVPERQFALMPLMHSEDLAIHDIARKEFTRLRDSAPASLRAFAENVLAYEEKHRAVIERFGRYPQRNEPLGRTSTEEERTFMSNRSNLF